MLLGLIITKDIIYCRLMIQTNVIIPKIVHEHLLIAINFCNYQRLN